MKYEKAIAAMNSIKTGEGQISITHRLGVPDRQKGNHWIYNFTKCADFPKLPPSNGEALLGVTLIFSRKTLSKVKPCWFKKSDLAA